MITVLQKGNVKKRIITSKGIGPASGQSYQTIIQVADKKGRFSGLGYEGKPVYSYGICKARSIHKGAIRSYLAQGFRIKEEP